MELALDRQVLRFARALRTAYGELRERELLRVELRASDGAAGRGEAAPFAPYDGVELDTVEAALEAARPVLAGLDRATPRAALEALRAVEPPQALAGLDLALWDLAGRRAGRPVAALLAERPERWVEVNATIAATDRAGAAAEARAAAQAGYGCVKVKVGVGDDAGRVAAVRAAAGPDVAIRVDANGAWEPEEALAALRVLAPAGIALAEEPARGLAALRAVRAGSPGIPVAMDETAAAPGAPGSGAVDAVCLKLARCGGIAGLLDAAAEAQAAGSAVYLASTYDGPAGIAGALHAAAALGPLPACGLATLALFERPRPGGRDPFPVIRGRIAVPDAPGLGLPEAPAPARNL